MRLHRSACVMLSRLLSRCTLHLLWPCVTLSRLPSHWTLHLLSPCVTLAVTLYAALAVAVRDAVSQAVALFVALAAAVNDMNTVCKLQQLCIDGRQHLAQTFDVTLFSLQWEHRPFSNPWLSAPANAMQPHYTLGLRARRRAVRA